MAVDPGNFSSKRIRQRPGLRSGISGSAVALGLGAMVAVAVLSGATAQGATPVRVQVSAGVPISSDLLVASTGLDQSGGTALPGALSVLSTTTNAVAKTIKVATDPVSLAAGASGTTAYLLGAGSDVDGLPGSLFSINVTTGVVGQGLSTGVSPQEVKIAPGGKTIYVLDAYDAATQQPSGYLVAVNALSFTATKPLKVAAGPTAMVLSPDGRSALVLGASTMSLVNLSGQQPKVTAQLALQAYSAVITPSSKVAYIVGHSVPGPIEVIPMEISSGALLPAVMTGASVPAALAISPNGQYVYVVGTPDPGLGATQGTVTVISTSTGKVQKTIDLGAYPKNNYWAVAVSPNGKTIYALGYGSATQQGLVVPVVAATGKAGKALPVGYNAGQIAFAANGKWAYVLDEGSQSGKTRSPGGVVPVNLSNNSVGKLVPVPAYAEVMAAG